jgi:hypothetical protein
MLLGPQHDRLDAVVEDLLRDAAQRLKRGFRAAAGTCPARVKANPRQVLDGHRARLTSDVPQSTWACQPGAISNRRTARHGSLALGLQVVLQNRVAGVILLAQLAQRDNGILDPSAQALVDVGLVRIQLAESPSAR